MKKKTIKIITIFGVICISWNVGLNLFTHKLTVTSDNIYEIRMNGFGGIDTQDKNKINKIVKYLNKFRYLKKESDDIHNEGPDISMVMINKEGIIIDRVEFFGNIVRYKDNDYKIFPAMNYNSFERFNNRLDEKK